MKNFKLSLYFLLFLIFILSSNAFALSITSIANRPDIQEFINEMVIQYQFDRFDLTRLFSQVNLRPLVISKATHPFEKEAWVTYKNYFVTPDRIQAGVAFWQDHQPALNAAYKKFGIQPYIIIAILGIETKYGKNLGNFRVIDSLSTLAFQYPTRANYFRYELTQFLLFCRTNKIDPLSVYGSYAGAFGMPQFMPHSASNYSLAYQKDKSPDIVNNADDAIFSVANYLHNYDWHANEFSLTRAKVIDAKKVKQIESSTKKAIYSPKDLEKYGLAPVYSLKNNENVGIIKALGDDKTDHYWFGLHNFYVIMQYNASDLYAMAVCDLGKAILQSRNNMVNSTDSVTDPKKNP